jgi:hypothetical protein
MEKGLDSSIQRLEEEVLGTMTQYGLVVNKLTPAQEQLWYDDSQRIVPSLMGTPINQAMYGRIDALLKAHRAGR